MKLLRDKPYEGSSAYGTYALYAVEHEGTEKAFFAPIELKEQIEAASLKAGDEIIVRKVAIQNGRRVTSKFEITRPERPEQSPGTSEATKEISKEDGLKSIMEQSLREAVEITRSVPGVPFQNEDIQKIASCLFIART